MTGMDVHQRDDLAFPQSLPEFQELFPDDATCAAYLERSRWRDGFVCPHCGVLAEPFRIATRPGILQCRTCRRQTGLLVGTIMERSHTPLNVWFWAAYLVASQTPGISAVQFQLELGLSRYETAFGILHKLRAGMVRPDQDCIGGLPDQYVVVDETYVGGRTRGEGRGVHHKVLVACAVEVRHRKPGLPRISGRMAATPDVSDLRSLPIAVLSRRADLSRASFSKTLVSLMIGAAMPGFASSYNHHAIAECGDPEISAKFLPMIHLAFANLKTWLSGIHHGVSNQHLQAYLNEFTFRFNRRSPVQHIPSLLGIAGRIQTPTFANFLPAIRYTLHIVGLYVNRNPPPRRRTRRTSRRSRPRRFA